MRLTHALRARLAASQMLVFGVDGVVTQGDIIYTDEGAEIKVFDVKDGLGLRVAGNAGLHLALMTGRSSRVVERRARDLHIPDVIQRVGDKAEALRQLAGQKRLLVEMGVFRTWRNYLGYPLRPSCVQAIRRVVRKDADVLFPWRTRGSAK